MRTSTIENKESQAQSRLTYRVIKRRLSCRFDSLQSKDMWSAWSTYALKVEMGKIVAEVPFPWWRSSRNEIRTSSV